MQASSMNKKNIEASIKKLGNTNGAIGQQIIKTPRQMIYDQHTGKPQRKMQCPRTQGYGY